jgi:hypothetical protein
MSEGGERRKERTSLEKVNSGVVASNVQPVLHVPSRLKSEHRKIVPPIVPEQQDPSRFEHPPNVLDSARPLVRVKGGENEDHGEDVDGTEGDGGRRSGGRGEVPGVAGEVFRVERGVTLRRRKR